MKTRVKKICEGFRATLYPCPEAPADRREMAMGVMTRIEDLNTVSFYIFFIIKLFFRNEIFTAIENFYSFIILINNTIFHYNYIFHNNKINFQL